MADLGEGQPARQANPLSPSLPPPPPTQRLGLDRSHYSLTTTV